MATGNFAIDNATEDIFNGVTLNLIETPCTLPAQEFAQHFEGALAEWRGEGRRGVWVHLPLKQVRSANALILYSRLWASYSSATFAGGNVSPHTGTKRFPVSSLSSRQMCVDHVA